MAGGIKKTDIVEADLNQLSNELKIVGDNIIRIIEVSSKVKPITGLTELSNATKQTSENSKELDAIGKRLAASEQRLKDLMDERTKAIIANNKAAQEQTAEMKRQAIIAKQVEDSYEAINASMNSNIAAYKKLSAAQRENEAIGGELIKTIQAQDAQLKQLDATMGRNQRNVGNYKSGFNGLNFSIMQVGRELPSLAYGVNVFASAISNNIPMVTDEIKKARAELAALRAEGKEGVQIWEQLTGAIFSWQTALVVGLTIFTMYGKEIFGFIGNLFKTKEAIDVTKEANDRLNKSIRSGIEQGQKELTHLNLVYNATQKHTNSIEQKRDAAEELKKQYPDIFKNFSTEEILAGKATKAYYELANSIMASVRARAMEQAMVENEIKAFDLEQQILEQKKGLAKAQDEVNKAQAEYNEMSKIGNEEAMIGAANVLIAAKASVESYSDNINALQGQVSQLHYTNKEIANGIDSTALLFSARSNEQTKESEKANKERLKSEKDHKKYLEDVSKDYNDIQFQLAKDRNKEQLDAEKDLENEIKRIKKQAANEQKAFTDETIANSVALADEEKLKAQEVAQSDIIAARNKKDEIQKIQHELTLVMIDEDIKAQQRILDTYGLEADAYEAASKRIRQLRLQRGDEDLQYTEKTEQEKQQLRQETFQATAALLSKGLEFSQQIYSEQAQRAQATYDAEMEAAGDSLEAQTLAKRKYEAEDKKIKQRQAIASKLQAVLDASLALALAIATTWKNPLLAALNISAATLGLGMALATPIPQFAEGTDNAPSSFIAGEEGSELIRTKSGKMILTPNKATLFSDNSFIGSQVFPHDQTQKMLANMAFNQVREVVDLSKTNQHLASMDKQMKNKTERFTDSKGRTVVKRGNLVSTL